MWFRFTPGCDMAWAAPRKYLAPLLSMAETHKEEEETLSLAPPTAKKRTRAVANFRHR